MEGTTDSVRAANVANADEHSEEVRLGATTPVPPTPAEGAVPAIALETAAGERLAIGEQVHFYTTNTLLAHPLVSPALSYLGGLPPLLVIASDAEVLRDEILYA